MDGAAVWVTDRKVVCPHRWAARTDESCTASVIGEHVCRRTSPEHRSHHCVCEAVLLPTARAGSGRG
jgi:hypothetical protein